MELGERLKTVAGLLAFGRVADVGADHGYLLLWLWQQGRLERGFACDLNPGPLSRAAANIRRFGAQAAIEPRLGSGLTPVAPGEAQACVMAGMGGMLMLSLLDESPEVAGSLSQLVLQPQRDLEQVRRGLHQRGDAIREEKLAREGRRFYTVIDARPGQETYTAEEYRFGKRLLDRRDPVLRDWLDWQIAVKENVPALAAEVAGLRRVRGLWTEEKGGA